jgi:transcriptional regulator with XRE-family HTH domain
MILAVKAKEHPIRLIRRELEAHPRWRRYATQQGFAALVGRSRSLIKHAEAGRVPVTSDLAHRISERTGIAPDWILDKDAKLPIRAADGGEWNAEMIPGFADTSILKELATRLEQDGLHVSSPGVVAEYLAALVRSKAEDELAQGGPTPFINSLLMLLGATSDPSSRPGKK